MDCKTIVKPPLTADRLREIMEYDLSTGIFTRKKRFGYLGNIIHGHVVGSIYKNGYVYITIERKKYLASRLAWLYVFGCWPNHEIDHKNNIRCDNRFQNLRDATEINNSGNRGPNKNNTVGYKGVFRTKKNGRWTAQISLNGKHTHLGCWDSPEEAARAYDAASVAHFGNFAKTNEGLGLLT